MLAYEMREEAQQRVLEVIENEGEAIDVLELAMKCGYSVQRTKAACQALLYNEQIQSGIDHHNRIYAPLGYDLSKAKIVKHEGYPTVSKNQSITIDWEVIREEDTIDFNLDEEITINTIRKTILQIIYDYLTNL